MCRKPLVVLATISSLSAALGGCAAGDGMDVVFPAERWAVATPESQGLDREKLLQAVEHVRSVTGTTGVHELMIVRNGYVVWQGDRVDHVQLIWSCTKSFLSTCLGLLWDDGLLTPGEAAYPHWPAMKKDYPAVTLEHLATFTSGYAKAPGGSSLDLAAPAFAPGTAFNYSSESDLLAAILTRIARRPLKELFLERIARPIGIDPNEFTWREQTVDRGISVQGGAGRPESGVYTNARTFARFGWLYANHGRWKGRQLISRRYVDYATVPRASPKTPPRDPNAWYIRLPGNYGLNWWTNGPDPAGRRHWPSAPARMFAAQGNRNNVCFIIPEWRMVVVRMGGDKVIDMSAYDGMFRRLAEALGRAPAEPGER